MIACLSSIRRRFAGGRLLLAATLLLGTTKAQIVNGGFESSPPFTGWTIEYGTYTGTFGPWVAVPPSGHPLPAMWAGGSPFGASFVAVAPYEGTQMALLNDPLGLYHATRISQTFNPTAADVASGVLAVQWGAVLENAHPTGQPGFQVEVLKNGLSVFSHVSDTNNAIAEGWQTTGPGDGFYYKHGQSEIALPGLLTLDTITVQLTVWDCDASGHGGFAFFDDVRFLTCTTPPRDMVGWWHDSTALDLAGPKLNSGTWNVPPGPTTDYVGGSGLNHASTSFVTVPDAPQLDFEADRSFSIDLWVKPTTTFPGRQSLVSKVALHPALPPGSLGYELSLVNGHPTLWLGTGHGTEYTASSVVVPPGEWTHLAVTVDRQDPAGTFYVNGEPLPDVFTPVTGSLANWQPLFLGSSGYTSPILDGETDEIELFRRVLTPAEVQRIFAAGTKGKCKGPQPDPSDVWVTDAYIGNLVTSGTNNIVRWVLPFPIVWDLPFGVTTLDVSTNGFLYLSNGGPTPGPATGFGSAATMVGNLRNGPPRVAPFWCNLDLQPANNAGVYINTFSNPDRVVITWKNAVEVGHTTLKTIQCQIFASGEVQFAYSDGITAEGQNVLVGISAGGGIADPGASDLGTGALSDGPILYQNFDASAQPFDLGGLAVMLLTNGSGYEAIPEPLGVQGHASIGTGCLGMTLLADVASIPGSVVTYTTSNTPEYLPGMGIYVAMTVISFGQIPGGLDLGILGAPDCYAYVASLDITASMLGFTPTLSLPLPLASSLPSGLQFTVQSVALAPWANPGGLVTTNAVETTVQ